jgi:aldehyde:ferredoxin oxidoreductase
VVYVMKEPCERKLSKEITESLARELLEAETQRKPVEPITKRYPETMGAPKWGGDLSAPRGKAVKTLECFMHVAQCAGLCCFGYLSTSIHQLPETLSAVTGWTLTLDDLLIMGERIANMRQAFNLREGLNPVAFKFPNRALGIPPLEEGPTKDRTVDINDLSQEYLEAMDWDFTSAKPSRSKLNSLGLNDVATDLY